MRAWRRTESSRRGGEFEGRRGLPRRAHIRAGVPQSGARGRRIFLRKLPPSCVLWAAESHTTMAPMLPSLWAKRALPKSATM